MAGSYPDAPGRRLAWDADGTVALITADETGQVVPAIGTPPSVPWSEMSGSLKSNLNSEQIGEVGRNIGIQRHQHAAVLFAEPHEVDGVFGGAAPSGPDNNGWHATSVDTTNGYDGTFVNADYAMTQRNNVDDYRNHIKSLAVASVKGVLSAWAGRFNNDVWYHSWHWYGIISPGQTPDRMLYLDTENSDLPFTKVLDYGDTPRGQSQQRTIKVKNNSTTKTISTVQITAEALYLNAGSWYEFSTDGVAFQATVLLGDFGPGAEQLVYVRQSIPDTETIGVQAGRFRLSHASVT